MEPHILSYIHRFISAFPIKKILIYLYREAINLADIFNSSKRSAYNMNNSAKHTINVKDNLTIHEAH